MTVSMAEIDLETLKTLLHQPSKEHYQKVLALLVQATNAERGCFWLEKENSFVYEGDEDLRKKFPFSREAVDTVLEKGRSLISFDTTTDQRFTPFGSVMMHDVRSCLCATCMDNTGEVLVLAYFDTSMSNEPFTEEDLQLLREVLSFVPGAVPVED